MEDLTAPNYEKEAVFAAMALLGPVRSTQLAIDYLRDPPEEGRTRIRPEPLWATTAHMLDATPEAARDHLLEKIFHSWIIDKVDY